MDKKYIVIAGKVVSRNDGDTHRVSAVELCRLYGVNPKECLLADKDRPETLLGLPRNLRVLRPRGDGKYSL